MYYFYAQELRLYTPLNNTLCRRRPAIYSLDRPQPILFSSLLSFFSHSNWSHSLNPVNIFKTPSSNTFHILPGSIAVAQWLRCCATNRKVAGSIPAGVIVIFH